MKRKTAGFGSVSTGTMRPEDLIPEFAYTLRQLRGSLPRDLHNDIRKCYAAWERGESYEWQDEVLESPFDLLNEYAPEYGYFGAHPGDGSDYAFWLCENVDQYVQDNGGLVVSDTSEVPAGYVGRSRGRGGPVRRSLSEYTAPTMKLKV